MQRSRQREWSAVAWPKIEEDGGWQTVLRGETGQTIIVEMPDPRCAVGSRVVGRLAQARRQVAAGLGGYLREEGWTEFDPPVPVTVTGVGFFDKIHGQRGVAPNGIELHPVVSVEGR